MLNAIMADGGAVVMKARFFFSIRFGCFILLLVNCEYVRAVRNCTSKSDCSITDSIPPKSTILSTCSPWEDNLDSLTQEQFIEKLTDPCRYDKLTRPHGKDPLNISVQMDIRHIEAVDQLAFRTHMWLLFRYNDSRLAYSHLSPKRPLILGQEGLKEKIWLPHVIVRNEKEKAIMGLAKKDIFISISPTGEVIYSYRMSATIYCWMNLRKFPFDTQTCRIEMLSWTYNSSYLVLQWEDEDPVKMGMQLHLTEYSLTKFDTFNELVTTSLKPSAFFGEYSLLVFRFELRREIGYYLITYYVPSMMLVVISWITFYLQADATPPRAVFGTSTMLSFITLSAGQTKSLPKVSYIKFSEIWFIAIALFIFASLAEFALVNMIWRRKKDVALKKKTPKHILKSSITPRLARKQFEKTKALHLRKSQSLANLDKNNRNSTNSTTSGYDHYLTVHEFPSMSNLPIIKTEDTNNSCATLSTITTECAGNSNETENEEKMPFTTMTPHEVANWIDKRSRVVFPIAFIIFNAFYWSFVYVF